MEDQVKLLQTQLTAALEKIKDLEMKLQASHRRESAFFQLGALEQISLHDFTEYRPLTTPFCEICEGQGLFVDWSRCGECFLVAHKGCSSLAPPTCKKSLPTPTLTTATTAHSFEPKNFKFPAFCNVCRAWLLGSGAISLGTHGVHCPICGFVAHDSCQSSVPSHGCKLIKYDAPGISMPHQLIEGNVHNRVCLVCSTTVDSNSLIHYRCVWCSGAVHTSCRKALKQEVGTCSFSGRHGLLVIPPTCVHPGPDGTITIKGETMETRTPLLVFVNTRSGLQQGKYLLTRIQRTLNPCQVFDLSAGSPAIGLRQFSSIPSAKIAVLGGDGSVSWVLNEVDRLERELGAGQFHRMPVAPVPLGTGNDLARSLGWGPGYDWEPLDQILDQIGCAEEVFLDRWTVSVNGDEKAVMSNYLGIGMTAKVTLDFHNLREKHPGFFVSRTLNQAFYALAGVESLLMSESSSLDGVTVTVDGRKLKLDGLQGFEVLNIQSYGGGGDAWTVPSSDDDDSFFPLNPADGILECVGWENLAQAAMQRTGLTPSLRLAQGREVVVTIKQGLAMPIQVDGEPWLQEGGVVMKIQFRNRVPMLRRAGSAVVKEEEIESD